MSAPTQLVHYAYPESSAAQLPDDHVCDILAPSGRALWYCCTVRDAQRLAAMRRAQPDAHPDWQGPLSLRLMDPATPRGERLIFGNYEQFRYIHGLPLGALEGCAPPLRFTGGTLGLDLDDLYNAEINVACGAWSASIDLELTLYALDRFDGPSRARLAAAIGWIFGVQLERGAS